MTISHVVRQCLVITICLASGTAIAQKTSSGSHLKHLDGVESRVPLYLEGVQCDPTELEEWSSIHKEIENWREVFGMYKSSSRLPADVRKDYQDFLDSWEPDKLVMERCAADKGREVKVISVDKKLISDAYEIWGRIHHFSHRITCDDEALAFYKSVHDAAKNVWAAAKESENGYWLSWTDQDAAISAEWRFVEDKYGFSGDKRKESRKAFDAKSKSCK